MQGILYLFRKFCRSRRGNIAVAAGLISVPLAIGGSLAIDASLMMRIRSEMRSATDAAVMAAALQAGSDSVSQYAKDTFAANLKTTIYGLQNNSPQFSYLGQSIDGDGNPVISGKSTMQYARVLSFGTTQEQTTPIIIESSVTLGPGEPACIFALSQTDTRAVTVTGSTSVSVNGCVVGSNSNTDDAVYVGGAGTLNADCVVSSGGIDAKRGLTTDCSANRTNHAPSPDPLRNLVEPVPGVVLSNPSKKDKKLGPGRYQDLTLDGTKTLSPGLYYVEGNLSIKGNISGTGVTFFMKDGAVKLNGNATLSTRPPTTGDYAGISFFGSRTNTNNQKFNGNGKIDIDGFVYFPAGDVTYQGNSTTYSECLRIIGYTVTMTGNSSVAADCSAVLGGREALLVGLPYFSK